jgi:hypothetical protein
LRVFNAFGRPKIKRAVTNVQEFLEGLGFLVPEVEEAVPRMVGVETKLGAEL